MWGGNDHDWPSPQGTELPLHTASPPRASTPFAAQPSPPRRTRQVGPDEATPTQPTPCCPRRRRGASRRGYVPPRPPRSPSIPGRRHSGRRPAPTFPTTPPPIEFFSLRLAVGPGRSPEGPCLPTGNRHSPPRWPGFRPRSSRSGPVLPILRARGPRGGGGGGPRRGRSAASEAWAGGGGRRRPLEAVAASKGGQPPSAPKPKPPAAAAARAPLTVWGIGNDRPHLSRRSGHSPGRSPSATDFLAQRLHHPQGNEPSPSSAGQSVVPRSANRPSALKPYSDPRAQLRESC